MMSPSVRMSHDQLLKNLTYDQFLAALCFFASCCVVNENFSNKFFPV